MFYSCSPVYHHRRRSAFLRQAARNGRFHHSRRIPPIDLKNRRTFTPFTSYRLVLGKLAEGSDKLAPRIGFWAQDLDKKNFLRLGSLRGRKFQGKKPKSFVHLLLEKRCVLDIGNQQIEIVPNLRPILFCLKFRTIAP